MVSNIALSQIALLLNGDRSTNYPSDSDFVEYGVPFINAGHLSDGKVDYSKMDYISQIKADSLSGAKIISGDILLCLRGTLGKYAFVEKDGGAPASSLVVVRSNAEKISPRYLYHVVSSSIFQHQILVENNGSSQPNLSAKSVMGFQIPFPAKQQQEMIADVLSDIDALIANLEKLIAKKKAIKQGAMQELLTGKRRLPGFGGEWEQLRIGDVLSIGHGMSQHKVETPSGRYPILATGGIIGRSDTFLWNQPSVLIGRKGTIDKPQYMETPFWTIDTLFYTRIKEKVCAKFIYYVFCMVNWYDYNEASGVPSLSAKTIESIKIHMPCYEEQNAIANLLTDMDVEIEEHIKKLIKYQNIKSGMMSELLTGRIRLTEKEDV